MRSRGRFVLNALKRGEERKKAPEPETKHAVEGEKHRLLGKEMTLTVRKGWTNKVTALGETLVLTVTNPFDDYLRCKTLSDFYSETCEKTVKAAVKKYYPKVSDGTFPEVKVYARNVSSYWGKCWRKSGKIVFAKKLVQMSLPAIESVVVHELCHFYASGHQKDFYAKVLRYMPDYYARQEELKRVKTYDI